MKATRIGILVTVLLFVAFSATAGSGVRTLINGERAPFLFAVIPPDRLVVPQSESSVARALQHARNDLRLVAPEGMVPIGIDEGILVGYFDGPASGLSLRAVVIPLGADESPVTVDRSRIIRVGGTAMQLPPWEIPSWSEPVMVDGLASDWEEERPVAAYGATDLPVRLEQASQGERLDPEESFFWRMGGTAVRRVYLLDGRDRWFVALRTDGPILNNTGYHLRVVTEEEPRKTILEFSLLVDGRSGPVVYRVIRGTEVPGLEPAPMRWAGQYALHDNFLEMEIDRALLRRYLRDADALGENTVTLDFAGSHRTTSRAEHFVLGSFPLPESLIAP
ncbi:MAG: hypothetical protein EA427_05890 [Spirochaetaceae bacterium]|nr:MAG: hypothetical protein EA427_05890 [Spirochaetaceae bacterium]